MTSKQISTAGLREIAEDLRGQSLKGFASYVELAAAEIERLRAALQEILEWGEDAGSDGEPCTFCTTRPIACAVKIARVGLGIETGK